MKNVWKAATAALLTVSLCACGSSTSSSDSSSSGSSATVYTGEAEGKNGTVKVSVTMDGDTITAVEVTEHSETEGICEPAIEQIPAAIVKAQSTDVDSVSGATVTSEAIKEAAQAAIDSAK